MPQVKVAWGRGYDPQRLNTGGAAVRRDREISVFSITICLYILFHLALAIYTLSIRRRPARPPICPARHLLIELKKS
jgi:hypothetical protein